MTTWQKHRQKLFGGITATLAMLALKYPALVWLGAVSGMATIWFDILDDILASKEEGK